MRLELLGDFEVLADRQPISTPSARHPLRESGLSAAWAGL
jgi:hypothetical protein